MGCLTPRRRSPNRLASSTALSCSASTASSVLTALASSASTVVQDDAPVPTGTAKRGSASDSTDSDADGFAELKQRRAEMAVVASRVWALYEAGVPLFTREALRHLGRQLDHHAGLRAGAKNAAITVSGMDGRQVPLVTQSGAVSASAVHPNIVLVKWVCPCLRDETRRDETGGGPLLTSASAA